jgi:HK97 family phage major capsid protein
MDRLFGTLELRAVNDELRTFEGVANTGAVDSYDTIVEPDGAEFTLPIPLLWDHNSKEPVGDITEANLVDGKWLVKGNIRKVSEEGFVKDLTDRAWHNVKYRLVRGLSIGFIPLKTKGNRFLRWLWKELSLVTIPANQEASIVSVRSAYLAASGGVSVVPSPGVSGTSTQPRRNMTIQEQITQHENSRAAKVAQRDALLEKSATEGRTLDDSESETFDTLDGEIRSIDSHLVRLNSAKKDAETRAAPVNGTGTAPASQSRSGSSVVTVKSRELPPGIGFARHAMALAVSRGNKYEAAEYAKRTWGDSADELVMGIREGCMALQTRSAVAPGSTTNATFAAPLVATNYITDFLDMLRPKTLIGRIQGLRHVPFNVSMPAQTAGGTYKWVGQGKWKPVTNAQYAAVTLAFAKASGIIVLTEELVRMSTPSAEAAVRDELVKGAQAFLDVQFVDSTVAAVANVNPASITNGVTGTAASAATGAAARADIAARVAALAALGYPVNELVILMSESIAFSLGLALNAVGGELFPGLTAAGGSIIGIPVVTSQSVGAQIIVAHAPSILMADENGVEIDVSREASLQLDSAPTDPADATAVLTSLWQANLVALRVERWITWGKARSTAVDRITSAAYTGA